MVVTIPRLGNTYLAAKALFEALEIPYIIPDNNSKSTLETGARLSPEEICLPFKIMMGNYIECIKKGADTIVMTGSCGPCRFGEYCELQMKLLKKLGIDAKIIVIDSPAEIGKEALWNRISEISGASSMRRMEKLKSLYQAVNILSLADQVDATAHHLAGYERNKGECKRLLTECKSEALKCNGPVSMRKVLTKYLHNLKKINVDKTRDPISITLIGEIYSMIEPFGNLDIEEKLMEYGVSSIRHVTTSWWIRDLIFKPLKLNSPDVRINSKAYLPYSVGGHARESIAHAVKAEAEKSDGIIQIYPLGCMPEIVAKSILPTIRKEKDIPVMTLVIDEMTGEAGYLTRIEAYLDMLEARKKRRLIV
ncbi:MAG: acyl-CoA dehydratase activase-related protein [Eubacteriales bacterium]|nr:acyl-CoA dehydratase activase-related protein [Eubacteriales bacterium]